MAVGIMPKQIREFLPQFNKRVILRIIFMNIIIIVAIATILILTHVFKISSIELWSLMIGLLVVS